MLAFQVIASFGSPGLCVHRLLHLVVRMPEVINRIVVDFCASLVAFHLIRNDAFKPIPRLCQEPFSCLGRLAELVHISFESCVALDTTPAIQLALSGRGK